MPKLTNEAANREGDGAGTWSRSTKNVFCYIAVPDRTGSPRALPRAAGIGARTHGLGVPYAALNQLPCCLQKPLRGALAACPRMGAALYEPDLEREPG